MLSFRSLVTKHPETLKKCFIHLPHNQRTFGNSLIWGARVTYPNWDCFQNESREGLEKLYWSKGINQNTHSLHP